MSRSRPKTDATERGTLVRTLVDRLATPALLAAVAIGLLVVGGDALPAWIANAATARDADPTTALRLIAGLALAAAALCLASGTLARAVAPIALVLLAFVEIAEVSAQMTSVGSLGALVPPVIVCAVAIALLVARGSSAPSPKASLAVHWQVLLALVLITASIAIAAQVDVEPRRVQTARAGGSGGSGGGSGMRAAVHELAIETWPGRRLADTAIARFVPDVVELAGGDGRHYVVFYSPRCGTCHELFDLYFSEGSDVPVLAISIPPSPDQLALPSDQPETVNCPECEHLALPVGPIWLVTPPVVVVVEDGSVTMIGTDEEGFARCIDGA